jgi:hypothetical protein
LLRLLLRTYERQELCLALYKLRLSRLCGFQLPLQCSDETLKIQGSRRVLSLYRWCCIVYRRIALQRLLRRCMLKRKSGSEELDSVYGTVWLARQAPFLNGAIQRTTCRACDA